jgi:hypothetical protein
LDLHRQTIDGFLIPITLNSLYYIQQKTPLEAAKFLVENDIVDHADFGKITDMVLINGWSKSIHDSVKTYPLLREEMQFTGSMQVQIRKFTQLAMQSRIDEYIAYGYSKKEALQEANNDLKNRIPESGGIAWTWNPKKLNGDKCGISGIVFNEEAEKNWHEDISNEIDSGFWAKADKGISYVLNHEIGHKFDRLFDLQNDHEIKALYANLSQKNKIKDEVSDYASTNISEFISECWAEFTCSKQPRQTANFVGSRIIEKYNAVK